MKNPPHTYIQKLQSFLDPSVTRKVKYKAGRPHLAAVIVPWGWGQTAGLGVGHGLLSSGSRFWVRGPWAQSSWLMTEGRPVTALLCPFPLYCEVGLISDRNPMFTEVQEESAGVDQGAEGAGDLAPHQPHRVSRLGPLCLCLVTRGLASSEDSLPV